MLTQDMMADTIKVTRVSVARWETGACVPEKYATIVFEAIKRLLADATSPERIKSVLGSAKDSADLMRKLFVDLGA